MNSTQLRKTANELVAKGKGILAADESAGTIQKRFDGIGLTATEQLRRNYREIIFRTPSLEDHISGVILYDETLRQFSDDGTPLPKILSDKGIVPGIKSDSGLKDLAGCPGEKVTEGLDGLRDRLGEWYELGARFSKWRAQINIDGDDIPRMNCLQANSHALARNAALSQEADIVPIVEPEVFMEGDHDIARCEEVTELALRLMYRELYEQGVMLEGTLLKPNMVVSGSKCDVQAGAEEVAQTTVRCFKRAVPAAVPGVVFLSGGQAPEQATEHLNAMNAIGGGPWELSFSYGRALLDPALRAWKGENDNAPSAQAALYHRAQLNGCARDGSYASAMEKAA